MTNKDYRIQMPDLSAITTMPNYPGSNLAEHAEKIVETLNSFIRYEVQMPDLSAIMAMPNYPGSNLTEHAAKMVETFNSFKYYELSSASKSESSLSIEDKFQIKEYIDKEVSQQLIKHISESEKDTIEQKKWIQAIVMWLIYLMLSPAQSFIEDQYKEILFDFIGQLQTLVTYDQKKLVSKDKFYGVDYQLVTTPSLVVKKNKHNQSETLGYVYSKQIVEIIRNKKDWTQIYYTTSLNTRVKGWVYTRYLTDK